VNTLIICLAGAINLAVPLVGRLLGNAIFCYRHFESFKWPSEAWWENKKKPPVDGGLFGVSRLAQTCFSRPPNAREIKK
jgi:hypothetical protein